MRLENDLKPHNKETYKKIKSILQTNNKTCVIQPTGSGKSYLILKLIFDNEDEAGRVALQKVKEYGKTI